MDQNTYQRVRDADDIDDAVVVRIWRIDGNPVGEASHPPIVDAQSQRVSFPALGNPLPVEQALAKAKAMVSGLNPFEKIYVQIKRDSDWDPQWGTLLAIKSSLQ